MRSFSFGTLTDKEFEAFSSVAPHGNFQQSLMAAKDRRLEGVRTHFVGVREGADHHVVAAALIETRGTGLATYCTIHDGPLCDFDDRELTVFFIRHLAGFARSQGRCIWISHPSSRTGSVMPRAKNSPIMRRTRR